MIRALVRLVPVTLVEVVARTVGYLVAVARPYASAKAESLVRGHYWAVRLGGGGGLVLGRDVVVDGENLRLGPRVRLHHGSQFVTGRAGWISVGADSHVARLTIVSGTGGVDIGAHCAIGPQVTIYSSSTVLDGDLLGTEDAQKAPVRIGDNVYIGSGARILPGVSIGDRAVIAAGAVVTRDVPAAHLARGVPARCTPRPVINADADGAASPGTP